MFRGKLNRTGRWLCRVAGPLALAFLLMAPALAEGGEVPRAAIPNKPQVTIRGNVVVDEAGAPTGFYELALCVQSPRCIYGPDPADWTTDKYLSEAEYATALSAIAGGTAPAGVTEASYSVTYYPFSAASAVVGINTDVLTAVNWDLAEVKYAAWDGANYASNDTGYPRGVDTTQATDVTKDAATSSTTDFLDTDPAAFPKVNEATLQAPLTNSVALDAVGDRSVFTAAAQVDDYDAATDTALVTLSAHAPDNKPVVFTRSTEVCVVRFSYDLKRFPKTDVTKPISGSDVERYTGAGKTGFWLGLNRGSGSTVLNDGKTPVTWLADTSLDASGSDQYSYSDAKAAATEAGQAVWLKLNSEGISGPAEWKQTEFYYYLGAAKGASAGTPGTVSVEDTANSTVLTVDHVKIPTTAGAKVIADGTAENPDPNPGAGDTWTKAEYSYYENVLYPDGTELRFELVNEETFRKPTGTGNGGNQILFYDWDDTLIGSLIVGDGDVRGAVNDYVENNLVHPDLRSGDLLKNNLGGTVPDYSTAPAAGSDAEKYQNLISSLDREYNYRGQYSSIPAPKGTVAAGGVAYPEDPADPGYQETLAGSNYPLTNKLDYVFYKHLNTTTTVTTENAAGTKQWEETYYTVSPLTDDAEAARYPWAYGWAIVEDPDNHTLSTKSGWPVMVDSDKLESTWTTFGSGELEDAAPQDGNLLSGFATPVSGTSAAVSYPGGLNTAWASDAAHKDPTQYAYMTSTADANGYLRFADFSDLNAMFAPGQDVLIVKAVYEQGTSLEPNNHYTMVPDSLNIYRLGTAASTENSIYAVAYQYQRVNTNVAGETVGVRRTREPAVRTGFVFDAKAVDTNEDLNAQKTFFLKNVGNNYDVMDIELTTSGALWSLEYTLLDIYGLDISNGMTRSSGGEWNLKTSFEYKTPADPNVEYVYDERQGTDSLVVDATLNTLLREATKEAKETGSGALADHASLRTIQDLNFKRDSNKTEYTGGTASRFRTYFQDLVTRLYNAGVSIDTKTGNVTLGWHQIQQHILMCEAAGAAVDGIFSGGTLMSEADCIAIGYEWCRMDTCGGNATMPLNSLQDVLKAVDIYYNKGSGDPGYKSAEKALFGEAGTANTGISGATLKGFGLRTQADGVPYDATAGDAALKTAILGDLQAAVTTIAASDWGAVTWTQVQTAIIQDNMGSLAPATLDLWWQPTTANPNGTPPKIDSWEKLFKYAFQATVGVDTDGDNIPDAVVPDAFDGMKTLTKAELDALIKEDGPAGTPANLGWLRKALDANDECVEFADATEFDNVVRQAVPALVTGGGYDTPDKLMTATWEEIQYAMLNPGVYKDYMTIMSEITAGTLKPMYWNDGGLPKLTFDKLLEAISKYYPGNDGTAFDTLLAKGIDPVNNEVYLRKDDTGAAFTDVAEFKNIIGNALIALKYNTPNGISDYTEGGAGLKWDAGKMDIYALQYILIHYKEFNSSTSVPDKATIAADTANNDYWWFDGGAPSGAMPIRTIRELFTAYFWIQGTSCGVTATYPDALNDLTPDVMKTLGLRKDDWGVPYPGGATADASLTAAVQAALAKMCPTPYSAATLSTASDADLTKELQHVLLTGNYTPVGSITDSYWWQGDGYPAIDSQTALLESAYKAYVGNASGETVPEAETALKAMTADFVNNRTKNGTVGLALRNSNDGETFPSNIGIFLSKLETVVKNLADPSIGNLGYADMQNVTQYQLQYFLLDTTGASWMNSGATLKTDAEIQAELAGGDGYWWFTDDNKPGAGPTRTLKTYSEADLKKLLTDVANYIYGSDTTPFDNGEYTADSLTALNFYNTDGAGGGTPFTDISEFMDYSWGDLASCLYYALQGAGYYDSDGVTLLSTPSWYEVQYAIITYGGYVDYATAKAISDDETTGYTWAYTGGTSAATTTALGFEEVAGTQASASAAPITGETLTLEELNAKIDELRQQLAELLARRDAMEAQTAETENTSASSSATATVPVTPANDPADETAPADTDNTTAPVEAPAAETEDDHDERPEIPLGEEVQEATQSATPAILSNAADIYRVEAMIEPRKKTA